MKLRRSKRTPEIEQENAGEANAHELKTADDTTAADLSTVPAAPPPLHDATEGQHG